MDTIVVGFTLTDDARRALDQAGWLAEVAEAKLVVLAVGDPHKQALYGQKLRGEPGTSAEVPASGNEGLLASKRHTDASGAEILGRARARLAERDIEVVFKDATGDAADAIVELADKVDADVIVVGTRDPGFVSRLVHHSVSDDVVHKTDRDVWIVKE